MCKKTANELIKILKTNVFNIGSAEIALAMNIDNKVLEFYKSTGYKIYYEFITYPNRRMYKLKKNLK